MGEINKIWRLFLPKILQKFTMQHVDPRSNTDFSVENNKGDPSFDTLTQDKKSFSRHHL